MTGMRIPGMRSYSNLGCKAGMTNPGCGMTDFPVCILLGCKHSSARAFQWDAKPVPSLKMRGTVLKCTSVSVEFSEIGNAGSRCWSMLS